MSAAEKLSTYNQVLPILEGRLYSIATKVEVKEIADVETGRLVKYLFFKPKFGVSDEKCHETIKELCELPGASEFVIMEDY